MRSEKLKTAFKPISNRFYMKYSYFENVFEIEFFNLRL